MNKDTNRIVMAVIGTLVIIGALVGIRVATRTSGSNVSGPIHKIEGIVTDIRLDCQPGKRLASNGTVAADNQTVCDAGDFITIESTSIQTAAGDVPSQLSYDKSLKDVIPGDQVSATYVSEGSVNTLHCSSCRLTKNQKPEE